jgi:hypothetical protein
MHGRNIRVPGIDESLFFLMVIYSINVIKSSAEKNMPTVLRQEMNLRPSGDQRKR